MENIEYHLIEKGYSMKCRLYPNKTQKKLIDDAIYAVQCFYNCTLWEIYNNHRFTTEKQKKIKGEETKEIVHFVKYSDIAKAEWKNKLAEEHPIINAVPSGAILSTVSGIAVDMKKSLGKSPIEFQRPRFYNKNHKRTSCSWQETLSKIYTNIDRHGLDDSKLNKNVLYINLNKIGICKIRGWNRKIRFDAEGKTDFASYAKENKKKQITITISKDNCNDYYIVFKLQDVYKPMKVPTNNFVGCDVGIRSLLITSNGIKYDNPNYKKYYLDKIKFLNKMLSHRQGWANIEFRNKNKGNKLAKTSNRYERTRLKYAKLSRKIQRKREWYNNNITKDIVSNNSFIGIEGLDVKSMFLNKQITFALGDAAMSDILTKLKYKAEWHNRIIQPINKWKPSSKRCNCCGYKYKQLGTKKYWTCPECNTKHDRDINAAKNILYYAILEYFGEEVGNKTWNELN